MDAMARMEFAELSRVVEVTSDAVAVCAPDGAILHANRQLLALLNRERGAVIGADVKDLVFSSVFERSSDHRFPFTLDGLDNDCMLKLADGSFVPVRVRALDMPRPLGAASYGDRVLVVMKSLEEQRAYDRETQRLLAELRTANTRLSGTLSVIMSAAGSKDLPSLIDNVLNKLVDTLEADGSTLYFTESGGFKLRGVSRGLSRSYVPEFIPYGAGIPTYVLREQRSCRLSVIPSHDVAGPSSYSLFDIDTRYERPMRVENVPPYRTLIAVPVYFGTQMLGIIELGWTRPRIPREYDARVLEVVCEYLSIELVGLVSSLRSQRTEDLTRSLNRIRECLYDAEGMQAAYEGVRHEIVRMLSCRTCSLIEDGDGSYQIDFEGGSRIALPLSVDETFFSTTAPAARVSGTDSLPFARPQGVWSCTPDDLDAVRLVRVDLTSWAGNWLASFGLPCQGVFIDLRALYDGDGGEAGADAGASAAPRMFLLLRDATQEPIDDLEYDYLVRLAHDFEIVRQGARKAESERRIAQTLQAGMRSGLSAVPGLSSDALYSSATQQALVGGDFYTLIRLPDDRAVMILGDVSGKGVEAASMSALVKTALTAYAWEGASPQSMVRSLNSMLMGFSRVETFATMFVAKIDLRSGVATYCSAGHPPTVLIRPGGPEGEGPGVDVRTTVLEPLPVQSGVVGAFENMVYRNGVFSFAPGDILFMYTDGAIEARDASGDFFGEQRLHEALIRIAPEGLEGLCSKVLAELDEFSGSALDDDIAMAALRFDCGAGDAAVPEGGPRA